MNGCIIPKTSIAVDYFCVRKAPHGTRFFLTHMHSDHTRGLTPSWNLPIYCSPLSKKLLIHKFKIPARLINALEEDQTYLIQMESKARKDVYISVSVIDANHCPGSVMYLFEGCFGRVLYTGDFSYTSRMFIDTPLSDQQKSVDRLYLDNTYCNAIFEFPNRHQQTKNIISIIEKHRDHHVLIGVRNLGKEDLLQSLALHFQTWILVSPSQYEILELLEVRNVFTTDPAKGSFIEAVPFQQIGSSHIQKLNNVNPTIAILPTALFLSAENRPLNVNHSNIFIIPYSDHSCYKDLITFVSRIQPQTVVPIVKSGRRSQYDISNMSCFHNFLRPSRYKKRTCDTDVISVPTSRREGVKRTRDSRQNGKRLETTTTKQTKRKRILKGVHFTDPPSPSAALEKSPVAHPDGGTCTGNSDSLRVFLDTIVDNVRNTTETVVLSDGHLVEPSERVSVKVEHKHDNSLNQLNISSSDKESVLPIYCITQTEPPQYMDVNSNLYSDSFIKSQLSCHQNQIDCCRVPLNTETDYDIDRAMVPSNSETDYDIDCAMVPLNTETDYDIDRAMVPLNTETDCELAADTNETNLFKIIQVSSLAECKINCDTSLGDASAPADSACNNLPADDSGVVVGKPSKDVGAANPECLDFQISIEGLRDIFRWDVCEENKKGSETYLQDQVELRSKSQAVNASTIAVSSASMKERESLNSEVPNGPVSALTINTSTIAVSSASKKERESLNSEMPNGPVSALTINASTIEDNSGLKERESLNSKMPNGPVSALTINASTIEVSSDLKERESLNSEMPNGPVSALTINASTIEVSSALKERESLNSEMPNGSVCPLSINTSTIEDSSALKERESLNSEMPNGPVCPLSINTSTIEVSSALKERESLNSEMPNGPVCPLSINTSTIEDSSALKERESLNSEMPNGPVCPLSINTSTIEVSSDLKERESLNSEMPNGPVCPLSINTSTIEVSSDLKERESLNSEMPNGPVCPLSINTSTIEDSSDLKERESLNSEMPNGPVCPLSINTSTIEVSSALKERESLNSEMPNDPVSNPAINASTIEDNSPLKQDQVVNSEMPGSPVSPVTVNYSSFEVSSALKELQVVNSENPDMPPSPAAGSSVEVRPALIGQLVHSESPDNPPSPVLKNICRSQETRDSMHVMNVSLKRNVELKDLKLDTPVRPVQSAVKKSQQENDVIMYSSTAVEDNLETDQTKDQTIQSSVKPVEVNRQRTATVDVDNDIYSECQENKMNSFCSTSGTSTCKDPGISSTNRDLSKTELQTSFKYNCLNRQFGNTLVKPFRRCRVIYFMSHNDTSADHTYKTGGLSSSISPGRGTLTPFNSSTSHKSQTPCLNIKCQTYDSLSDLDRLLDEEASLLRRSNATISKCSMNETKPVLAPKSKSRDLNTSVKEEFPPS